MSYNKEILAANLRSKRAFRGLSRRQVADATGIKASTLGGAENATTDLTYMQAWILADFYDTTLAKLGGRDETRYEHDTAA